MLMFLLNDQTSCLLLYPLNLKIFNLKFFKIINYFMDLHFILYIKKDIRLQIFLIQKILILIIIFDLKNFKEFKIYFLHILKLINYIHH